MDLLLASEMTDIQYLSRTSDWLMAYVLPIASKLLIDNL